MTDTKITNVEVKRVLEEAELPSCNQHGLAVCFFYYELDDEQYQLMKPIGE